MQPAGTSIELALRAPNARPLEVGDVLVERLRRAREVRVAVAGVDARTPPHSTRTERDGVPAEARVPEVVVALGQLEALVRGSRSARRG